MLLALTGGVYSLASLFSATAVLRHTSDVRVKVADLRASLHEAETGLRGFLVTGERSFLEPYTRAQTEWRGQLGELRGLTTDNADQQSRLKRLEALVERELANPDVLREVAGPGEDVARVLPLMAERKRTMDGVRAVLGDMEAEEAQLDDARETEARRHWISTAGLLIASAVALLLGFAVFVRQRRAAEVRRVRSEEEQRLLKAVFAGIHEGITLLDRSGRLVFSNAAEARMIGFPSVEELL
jgi:CHASE3 domain sensor protein